MSRSLLKQLQYKGLVVSGIAGGCAIIWTIWTSEFRLKAASGPQSSCNCVTSCPVSGASQSTCYQSSSWQNFPKKLHLTCRPPCSTCPSESLTKLPSRADLLKNLKEESFEILVIGGGAVGCGVALDAVSRGLKTALVEMEDFSSGTSSRSTKLLHGGIRYLKRAIFKLDFEQFRLVKESLRERYNVMRLAPHLTHVQPILLPVYSWMQVPYYWLAVKSYDFISGRKKLRKSHYVSKQKAIEYFPMINKKGLVGGFIYYDGQHNDVRLNVALAMTGLRQGATIVNHVTVIGFLKHIDPCGAQKICGVMCRDNLTGCEFQVKSRCVINAAGPFIDCVRKLDDASCNPMVQPCCGTHIMLPDYYGSPCMGLLNPVSKDDRVTFVLPYEGYTLVGTTDDKCELTRRPTATDETIRFLLDELCKLLTNEMEVRRCDITAAWAGIRPLIRNPNKPDTHSIVRNHIMTVSDSHLITIGGGKWTTYRAMAEQVVEFASQYCGSCGGPVGPSKTLGILLEGAHEYSPITFIHLIQEFGLESEVARHLAITYGDKAFDVAKLAKKTCKKWPIAGVRLSQEFPCIEAEVRYAAREYACTAIDVIARRLGIAFLNCRATEEALPRIIEILSEELCWTKTEQKCQHQLALQFLQLEAGMDIIYQKFQKSGFPISLSRDEIKLLLCRFQKLDIQHKGYLTIQELLQSLKRPGQQVAEEDLRDMLCELEIGEKGQIDLGEYLQFMCYIKACDQLKETTCDTKCNIPVLIVPDTCSKPQCKTKSWFSPFSWF